jgi:murein DD-endopeptidase MepM/ murein hydrolase activator NlpD
MAIDPFGGQLYGGNQMRKSPAFILTLLALILIISVTGCQLGTSQQAAAGSQPEVVETPTPLVENPTAIPQIPETQTPTELPPAEPPDVEDPPADDPPPARLDEELCSDEVCVESGSFLLERPIAPTGRNTIDPSYRYGDYRHSTRTTHRGVDFLNSSGTPVLAAADGQVVVAGDDLNTPYGPRKDFYGNLVILEHNLPEYSSPIFTLYAHLSEVSIDVGDPVSQGQEIGLVGMTGNVPGSTLHFEVRVGENSYLAARNPELWLVLLVDESDQPLGALAGRILDDEGVYQPVENIVVEQLAGSGLPAIDQFYLRTYEKSELMGLTPWKESFALSDLPPGEYQISFMLNGIQQQVVEVLPGQLTVVTFEIE